MPRRPQDRTSERGAALVLALFIIVVLTFLGLGLVLQTSTTTKGAGAERTVTKNFYAADSGIHAGFTRLQVNNPCAFQFQMADTRGAVEYPIGVNVAESIRVGNPQFIQGGEVGGGLTGGGTALVYMGFRMNAGALEPETQTRRLIEAEVSIGPTTPQIMPPCSAVSATGS